MLSVSNRRLLAIELTAKGVPKTHIKKRLRGSTGGPKAQTMKQQDQRLKTAVKSILVMILLMSIMFADNLFNWIP